MIQKFLVTWLPTVMAASFAFTLPVLSIINDYSDRNFRSEHERFEVTMRTIQGSLVVSSFLTSFIGFSLNGHLLLSSPRLVLITLLNSKLNKVAVQNALSLYHPLLGFPYPFQWGAPIFRASHVFGMMGAAIVKSAEVVGMLLEGIFGGAVGTTASV
ncbi:hypothetical protein C1H46_016627 [Malus baccata]|uniref:Uncharacterized protein n=1 Tax=Malus baccata TaxID=106549 RepID=A0A540MGC4_MALBA|nr:hypothetical protein C1H46_016627 [Malus baccata]